MAVASSTIAIGENERAGSAAATWHPIQLLVLSLCFLINALDGMDVLIMSYVAPALAREWNLNPSTLGIVFSAGLAGMMVGSIIVAPLADRLGRRRMILASMGTMTVAMILTGLAESVLQLVAARFVVGIGIGTVLASMAALTAEYAPARHRALAVSLLQAGYPLGAVATGFACVWSIPMFGWQATLIGAGLLSAVAFPLVYALLPESLEFLLRSHRAGTLERVNRINRRLGRPLMTSLPARSETTITSFSFKTLLSAENRAATLFAWGGIFCSFMVLYFVISWIPKLAVEAGLEQSKAIIAGALYNIGAFCGTFLIGILSVRFRLQRLIACFLITAAVTLVIFGSVALPLFALLAVAFLMGASVQGGFNGYYPLVTLLYPSEVRSTGLGWAIGIGRTGAIFGPLLGGWLLSYGTPLPILFGIFAVPLLIAAVCALSVRKRSQP